MGWYFAAFKIATTKNEMATTVAMQQLQHGLKAVEDDLGSFIKSQKSNLRKEKLQLERRSTQDGVEQENIKFRTSSAEKVMVTTEETGLNLGGYANKQEKLREERQKEYKQYLQEQSKRRVRGGVGGNMTPNRTKGMVSDEILENTNVSRYNKK